MGAEIESRPSRRSAIYTEEVFRQNEREAKARADAAEARAARARSKDDRPPSSGPRSSGRSAGNPELRRLSRKLQRLGTRHPKRMLVTEMLGVMTIRTVSALANQRAPEMSDYIGAFAVYLILAFMTEIGEGTARLAAGLGALVFLATLLAHGDGLVKVLSVVQPAEGR